jgi:hypothetical protein
MRLRRAGREPGGGKRRQQMTAGPRAHRPHDSVRDNGLHRHPGPRGPPAGAALGIRLPNFAKLFILPS